MTVVLWIAAGVLFWFVCGYFAAKILYVDDKNGFNLSVSVLMGTVAFIWNAAWYIYLHPRSMDNFWRKFLRIKD